MKLQDSLFRTVESLSDWLNGLQISTPLYSVNEALNGVRTVKLRHPVEGHLDVPIGHFEGIKRFEGIGLQSDDPAGISIKCYDYGGIFDPIDGFIPGDHYAASHYALIDAILIRQGLRSDLAPILKAFEFQQRTGQNYAFSRVDPHWEFNNLAWLEVLLLLHPETDQIIVKQLRKYLSRAPRHIRPFATNWKAMLGCFLVRLGRESKSIFYQWLGYGYIKWSLRAYETDGCIADIYQGSRSIQYHFYTAAVFARFALLTDDLKLKKISLKAAHYGELLIDPDGNCNFKGRGQGQIFGYAAAVYLYVAAASLDPENATYFIGIASKIYQYLKQWQNPSGYFPLVLNNLPEAERVGWHDYHHLTVYNAFAGAWLGLAALELSSRGGADLELALTERDGQPAGLQHVEYHEPSGVLIASSIKNYYLCVSRGENYYDTDTGFAPHHIWWQDFGTVVSSPGGPDRDHYGKLYRSPEMDWNYYAPLVHSSETGELIGPARMSHGKFMKHAENIYQQSAQYGCCHFERIWEFGMNTIQLFEEIECLNSSVMVYPVNIPLLLPRVIATPIKPNQWELSMSSNSVESHLNISLLSNLNINLQVLPSVPLTAGMTTRVVSQPLTGFKRMTLHYTWYCAG